MGRPIQINKIVDSVTGKETMEIYNAEGGSSRLLRVDIDLYDEFMSELARFDSPYIPGVDYGPDQIVRLVSRIVRRDKPSAGVRDVTIFQVDAGPCEGTYRSYSNGYGIECSQPTVNFDIRYEFDMDPGKYRCHDCMIAELNLQLTETYY